MSDHWNPQEAVGAHAATTRSDRAERRPVELTGQALFDDGRNFWVRVINLSYDGCMVVCEEALTAGQSFKLSVLGRGGIEVEVVWTDRDRSGLLTFRRSNALASRLHRVQRPVAP